MNIESTTASHCVTVNLQDKAVFTIPDAHDMDIECRHGTLWITVDHDRRDIVLEPGQRFRGEGHRRVLVAALGPSRLHLAGARLAVTTAPVPARAPRRAGFGLTGGAVPLPA